MAIWVFSKGGGFKLFTLYDVLSYHTLFMGLVGKEKTRRSSFWVSGGKMCLVSVPSVFSRMDETLLILLYQWIAHVVHILARGLQRVRRHGRTPRQSLQPRKLSHLEETPGGLYSKHELSC